MLHALNQAVQAISASGADSCVCYATATDEEVARSQQRNP